ncbi:MAG: FAD-binding domain-containing protein [Myxococcota bacterium]
MSVQVVWLKRDLRLTDHLPLVEAAKRGPVALLYVYEPDLWAEPEFDGSHLGFIGECLDAMDEALAPLGTRVVRCVGRLRVVLDELRAFWADQGGLGGLFSHQETGGLWTYARDRRVGRWCRNHGVPWSEFVQDGVERGPSQRDGWASRWKRFMQQPLAPEATWQPAPLPPRDAVTDTFEGLCKSLGMVPTSIVERQPGGASVAEAWLDSFLRKRVVDYAKGMSSPVTAWEACSRLSPYLAWGALSQKQVLHRLEAFKRGRPKFREGYEAFQSRLAWRSHFIQKLEDEPEMEVRSLDPAVDRVRPDRGLDLPALEAWMKGETGYPLVDACMRALARTGWINFRMRAMVVSFSSYHLWQPWPTPAKRLARHFLDFEPGIHYPQFQMQSGTTGINALRIYDPVKQVRDQDPDGQFIRQWVPELARVPVQHLAEPHRMSGIEQAEAGCRIGVEYPAPIVENVPSIVKARRIIESVRRRPESRARSRDVHRRHGSRRGRRR